MPRFVWPLIALCALVVGWVAYLCLRVFADLGDPPSGQLAAIRLVGLALVLTSGVLLARDRSGRDR